MKDAACTYDWSLIKSHYTVVVDFSKLYLVGSRGDGCIFQMLQLQLFLAARIHRVTPNKIKLKTQIFSSEHDIQHPFMLIILFSLYTHTPTLTSVTQ